MNNLVKQLFCLHKYKNTFSILYSYSSNQSNTYHIYTCCKCGSQKRISIGIQDYAVHDNAEIYCNPHASKDRITKAILTK